MSPTRHNTVMVAGSVARADNLWEMRANSERAFPYYRFVAGERSKIVYQADWLDKSVIGPIFARIIISPRLLRRRGGGSVRDSTCVHPYR